MDVTIESVNRTNQALIENIKKRLLAREWKIPQLAKATGLSASGLYGVMDGTRWPGPDNLERIAKALGTTAGALLETPLAVEAPKEPQEQTREQLFAALVEKAIHLDKDGLALLLAALDAGLSDSDCEPMSRLKNDK